MSSEIYFRKTKTEYASFLQRIAAHVVDSIVIGSPVIGFMFYILLPAFLDVQSIKAAKNHDVELAIQFYQYQVYISLIAASMMAAALAFFITTNWQATPGKRLMGIYVTMRDGSKPKFLTAFGRFVSLPLFLLLIQIFERNETYQKLADLKTSGKQLANLDQMETYLTGPVTELTNMLVLVVIAFWYLKIVFSPEHTAVHDMLFETRVLKGKK